ncbi:MAG: TauD/TfdA family dioxygenase [Actinomycetota bacterium]|nr:TauD/TfdA family dioxygenase [Actinomycetota bacterium]
MGAAAPDQPIPVSDMKDLARYANDIPIIEVVAGDGDGTFEVVWADGERAGFTHLWLRDNCACDTCRHPQTLERVASFLTVPLDIEPLAMTVTDRGALAVSWPGAGDGDEDTAAEPHPSVYDPGWLRTMAARRTKVHEREFPIETWGALGPSEVPSTDHGAAMTTDEGLRDWLTQLTAYGISLLTDGPAVEGEVLNVAERISKNGIRPTAFGTVFEVFSKPHPNNAAYTPVRLMPHIDLPNYTRPPDYQFLYCVANEADGGESTFVDGFKIADVLRTTEPEHFEVLASTLVSFRFQDHEYDIRYRSPMIVLDPDGKVVEVRVNDWIRDTTPDVALADERAFYAAYRSLLEKVEDRRYQLRVKLGAGQMVAFDNRRVLHGRESFDPNTGERFLQGLYVERDFVRSRLRVLDRSAV